MNMEKRIERLERQYDAADPGIVSGLLFVVCEPGETPEQARKRVLNGRTLSPSADVLTVNIRRFTGPHAEAL